MEIYEKLISRAAQLTDRVLTQICSDIHKEKEFMFLPKWAYACFLPLGYCAEQCLAGEYPQYFTQTARRDLRDAITDRLAYLGRWVCVKLVLTREKKPQADLLESGMQGICRYMIKEGYHIIQEEYPALAELVNVSLADFLSMNRFFLQCLAKDWPEVKDFCRGPGKVTGIFQEMKELHPNDKNVHILALDNGEKVVFKQEEPTLMEAWEHWCRSLNNTCGFHLAVPRQLLKNGYIWQEYVAHREVMHESGIGEYFERCGELLCILHLMNAKDIQAENIIACENNPVLIDLETIINGSRTAQDISVRDTYFLPGCQSFQYIKRDMAALAWEEGRPSLPVYQKKTSSLNNYVKELAEGFTKAYRILQEHTLVPGNFFSRTRFRYVLRPTWLYAYILNQGLFDKNLISREAFLQSLCHERLLPEELRMLKRGYIPIFHQFWNSRDLYCGDDGIIKDFLECTPAEVFQGQIDRMDEKELKKQLQMLYEVIQR